MAWVQRLMRVMILMTLLLSACTSDPNVTGGPRLVQEATLQPTDVLPVRVSTMTPIVIPVSTSELSTPLPAKTIEGEFPNFVLVTPTLPPSKTPTLTPSREFDTHAHAAAFARSAHVDCASTTDFVYHADSQRQDQ